MTRHIEFTINFDLTCWGEDWEDFAMCRDEQSILESVEEYIADDCAELFPHIKITKVWYEED